MDSSLKNLGCDFVALVTLNRGFPVPRASGKTGIKSPDFYVLPISYVSASHNSNSTWGKVAKRDMSGLEDYRDRWELISDFLENSEP